MNEGDGGGGFRTKKQKLITDYARMVDATNNFLTSYNTYMSGDAGGETSGDAGGETSVDASQYKGDLTSITLSPEEYQQLQLQQGYSTTLPASPDMSLTRSTDTTLFNGLQRYIDGLNSFMLHQAGSMDSTVRYEQSDTDDDDDDKDLSSDASPDFGGNLSHISDKDEVDSFGSEFVSDSEGDLELSDFENFTSFDNDDTDDTVDRSTGNDAVTDLQNSGVRLRFATQQPITQHP